jgi:ribosome assembly protein 4
MTTPAPNPQTTTESSTDVAVHTGGGPERHARTPGSSSSTPYYVKPSKLKAMKEAERAAALVIPEGSMIVAKFKSPEGDLSGPTLNLPAGTTPEQLQLLLNQLLENVRVFNLHKSNLDDHVNSLTDVIVWNQQDDPVPYAFYIDETEVTSTLHEDAIVNLNKSKEDILTITYQPQAVFKVRAVTRCTSSMNGHTEAVLTVQFSPDGTQLATGSGDKTIRIWDLNTETPQFTLEGHTNWVQIVAWSPDCKLLASGSMDKTIRIWDPKKGKPLGDALRSHTQVITSIAWEPMHL